MKYKVTSRNGWGAEENSVVETIVEADHFDVMGEGDLLAFYDYDGADEEFMVAAFASWNNVTLVGE